MSQTAKNGMPSDAFIDALRERRHPFIVAHVTPDADAIGSALGLATAFRDAGIESTVGLPEDCVATKLTFMLELATDIPKATTWKAEGPYDSVIVLDTAGEKRINIQPAIDLAGDRPVFNIDHHITNTDFGRYNWVDPRATSTCELIARLLGAMDRPPRSAAASLLYSGIHGDTAGFSLASTSADSLHTAADLVVAGADVAHIGEQLCRSQAHPDFELLRRVYDHTQTTRDGLISYSYLTLDDFRASGSKAENIDDQVSIPMALKGIRIAMLFTEGNKGEVRINLRGEGNTTVVELAQQFGGGGHSHSAGVRIRNRPLEDVIREVIAAAQQYLHSSKNKCNTDTIFPNNV